MDDNVGKYRPHEIPANHHIIDDAGDAGGILPSLAVLDHRPILSRHPHPMTRMP
jgi:hypothetical protein